MKGSWVTKALGKSPPVDNFGGVENSTATLLIQGRNTFGDEIYTYLKVSLNQIDEVKLQLTSGENFVPSHYGTVLAAGRGKPSDDIKREVGQPEFMVYFEPNRLPGARPTA